MNHQLESRMRENRTYGSEGGGTLTGPSYAYPALLLTAYYLHRFSEDQGDAVELNLGGDDGRG